MMALLQGWAAQPDVAVCLLTLGMLLLYVEANRPGRVLPGCVGLFLVLLSLASGRGLTHAHWLPWLLCATVLALATACLLRIAWAARRNKFVLGRAGLVHKRGRAVTALAPEGRVEIAGELWPALSAHAIAAGRPIVVTAARAGLLQVRELAR